MQLAREISLNYSLCPLLSETQDHSHSAMACFRLLRVGYDTEVICVYGMEPVFYCLLLIIVLCDLYFVSHILLC